MPTRANVACLALLAVALPGCEHALWGNMMALSLTLGLFFGTLQLGKRPVAQVDAGRPTVGNVK